MRRAGTVLLTAGIVLLLAALVLLRHNRAEDSYAARQSERLLKQTEQGGEACDVLEIPALTLKLPVLPEWDDAQLKIAPCRQFGAAQTDDLVIAGHNYPNHFGRLHELAVGERIIFTDADGQRHCYAVADIRVLAPTEVAAVRDSGFPLVLYTCTYGGHSRVTVFCSRGG